MLAKKQLYQIIITMDRKLKIGLDFHGVINQNFDFFREFCRYAQARGHLIYIISGGPLEDIKKTLDEHLIAYSYIFAIYDHFKSLGKVDENNRIDDELWNKAKKNFWDEHHIDFHLDDSPEYCRYAPDVCSVFDHASQSCSIFQKKVLLNSPLEFLKEIELNYT